MSVYRAPDIYVEEVPSGARPIERVGTDVAGFVGLSPDPNAHLGEAVPINNWLQFLREFAPEGHNTSTDLSNAVYGFFQNGGNRCYIVNVGSGGSIVGGGRDRVGCDLLEEIDEISIVAAPGFTDAASYDALLTHCENLEDRVAILDGPESVDVIDRLTSVKEVDIPATSTSDEDSDDGSSGDGGGLRARQSDGGYGAFYFPWIVVRDPLTSENSMVSCPPSGHIAGIWARSDATRGVHKAPANEHLRGAFGVMQRLTRTELGMLNQASVCCIRAFAQEGIKVWGARTLAASSSEYRYLNVRRLQNMIKESIAENTRWIVFEPNDYTLWKSIRRDISAFLIGLWRDGALMGRTPEEAFFVKCDEETNPPDVIDSGQVVTLIGISPVKPAEFIIFRLSHFRDGSVEE